MSALDYWLRDAMLDGLSHMTLARDPRGDWQAAARYSDSSGYLVNIQPDAVLALVMVLDRHRNRARVSAVLNRDIRAMLRETEYAVWRLNAQVESLICQLRS